MLTDGDSFLIYNFGVNPIKIIFLNDASPKFGIAE